ncbi:MAG TPA: DEAD/DEAH box helicase [Cytophagaceae bacterium]|jgi:ATP-dependent RNA helicase RhlE|nr:DEAD/DEAH box helicase [Cytophagaceae bacterium]
MTFEDFKLNKQLLNAVSDLSYSEPTEIQLKAIPQILAGHDVMGIAQTGTGKTAAYLLPILMKIKFAQGDHPRVLILVPTRELAMQVHENVVELSKYTDIRSVVIYGGVGPKTQIENIQKGVDIIVATPGRFMDIYLKNLLATKFLNTLVLDEADKIMDMGFMPQIRKILEVVPRKRQNLLFSATMSEKVEVLTQEFLTFPLKIEATPQATPVVTVTQVLYHVPNFKTKINLLQYFLRKKEEFNRVIVFVRTRQNAENIFKFISRKIDSEVKVIHANKGQNTRTNSVEAFKEGGIRVLVATDVAARGIDISLVSHVINFDVPVIYEDYVHRIGRTGRAKNEGDAITFANDAEKYHMAKIEKIIKMKVPVKEIPEEVTIEETPVEERQEILRELDALRKKDDPTFKGAFHEKKNIPVKTRVRKKPFKPGGARRGKR